MSHKIIHESSGHSAIVLTGEPQYCHALKMAPGKIEPELKQGLWLVLAFATWSPPDIQSIGRAISVAKRFNGKIELGIRPFEDVSEIEAWCPDVNTNAGTPLWLILQDGDLMDERAGLQSETYLEQWISSWI